MPLFSVARLDRLNPTQGGVRGMRVVATGLLVAMAAVYCGARALEASYPAAGYVRAFAEAAMVGGLADWFAVTALFRHPMGLPIPHTAIIPRNKDRIGDTLAVFLRDNFLTASVVARRMRRLDVAASAGRWLSAPSGADRVGEGAGRLLGDVIEGLTDDRLGGMVRGAIVGRLRSLDLAPLLGRILGAAIDADRHVPMLDGAVHWASRTLSASSAMIRQMVHDRAGKIMRWTGLDETLAEAIVEGLTRLLDEMAENPEHPLRAKAEEALADLARRLRDDPEMRRRVAELRDELVANPAVAAWIDTMWQAARDGLLRTVRSPGAVSRGRLGELLRELGQTLEGDARLRDGINRFTRRAVVGTVARYGDGIVTLVSETIRRWDAQTVTDRLESAVGRDLQYIRINGTLVGGLVGLGLHLLDGLF